MTDTRVREIKVSGHSVQKLECKQTEGQTDGGDCITLRAKNVVGKYLTVMLLLLTILETLRLITMYRVA